jgi:hypothetical protein
MPMTCAKLGAILAKSSLLIMTVALVCTFLVHYRVSNTHYLESEKFFIVFECLCALYILLYLFLFVFVMIRYKVE